MLIYANLNLIIVYVTFEESIQIQLANTKPLISPLNLREISEYFSFVVSIFCFIFSSVSV